MTQTTYDAIVIGSGPNGLAAAIRLAEAGRSVLVVEARTVAGGAVATGEVTLPGFRHDLFSAVYPAAVASPVFARMPLAAHGLRWVHPPVAVAHPFPDGRAAALYRDVDATVANLDAFAPGDGGRWREFVSPYLQHFEAMRNTMLSGWPPVRGGLQFVSAFRLDGSLEFARLLLLSAEGLARDLFTSSEATAWLYGSAMHADVPNSAAGSAIGAFYLYLLGHTVGWPSPEGGAGTLATALVRYLGALGGMVRLGTPVVRIVVEHGRVAGIITQNGDMLRARVVIGDLTPRGLIRLTGDALPAPYVAKLGRFRMGQQSIKVDWALDAPVPWDAPEARLAGTVHVGGLPADLDAAVAAIGRGELPQRPFVLFGQQSLADPTRAPAGNHTAWGYTHVPTGIDWIAERDRYVERIEAHIERFAPGFRSHILARYVQTPHDLERANANLVGGDVGGGSYALDQLVFRPFPTLSPYRTPVHGLYIGSASTFPGAAVHGVAGDAAARLVLFDFP